MDDNREFAPRVKSSVFNRSFTIVPSAYQPSQKPAFPTLDRSASAKKWFNSFETAGSSIKGKVRLLRNLFEPPQTIKSGQSAQQQLQSRSCSKLKDVNLLLSESILNASTIRLPGAEDRVVLYFTSLRGVRRTFEDCYAVRTILRCYKVYVDERDVSMDSSYRKDLQSVMGEKNVSLPQVFIKGRYLGGAEMIKHLNEMGELRRILETLPLRERGVFCDTCGDVRFIPCIKCSGSRKLFDEVGGSMKRCSECNENGLVRCPACFCDNYHHPG